VWRREIVINPNPKSTTSDLRDPLGYRGITSTPVVYTIYSHILINRRIPRWEEANSILDDKQNGFRKGRSTIDHLSTLTSIIETRQLKRKPTFAAFIDMKKAYYSMDRVLVFTKLHDIGIVGNMYEALLSLYNDVKCRVRLNGVKTD
jgi:hypothetical protein